MDRFALSVEGDAAIRQWHIDGVSQDGESAHKNKTPFPVLLSKAESLGRKKTIDPLKPGLGEIMGVIQQYHAKLYYAGAKANWPLAEYELGEFQESLADAIVQTFAALSLTCSNCHAAANHPFVRIQTPTEAMFSNQNFAP